MLINNAGIYLFYIYNNNIITFYINRSYVDPQKRIDQRWVRIISRYKPYRSFPLNNFLNAYPRKNCH